MTRSIRAYAAATAGGAFAPFTYTEDALGPEEVDIAVTHCGICHSDLSMLDNEWQRTRYPFVGGHEVAGIVAALGERVRGLRVGQKVGLGWQAGSCMHCGQCLSGNHNLCGSGEATIVGRHGGFAERVRAHWAWVVPLPDALEPAAAGPLFCGGITVFNPILEFGVLPTDRVGVVGIGGLGHLALKFLRHWGCEVTAFTSSAAKHAEALELGAHHVVGTRDGAALKNLTGRFDFLIVTSNVALDWTALVNTLAPKGRLHVVGAVLEPMPIAAFSLIGGQKSVSGSPIGSPSTTARMLEFCARHAIAPEVEVFAMSRINDAFEHLRAGKARYRVVLESDWD